MIKNYVTDKYFYQSDGYGFQLFNYNKVLVLNTDKESNQNITIHKDSLGKLNIYNNKKNIYKMNTFY